MYLSQVRSAVGLITAAQYGYTAALVPLSTMVATSVGVSGLLRNFHTDEGNALLAFMTERIPLPTSMAGSGQTGKLVFTSISSGALK